LCAIGGAAMSPGVVALNAAQSEPFLERCVWICLHYLWGEGGEEARAYHIRGAFFLM